MIEKDLLDILVCPKCKGELEYQKEKNLLLCHQCRLQFRIDNDIPIMLLDEAESF